MIEIRWKRIEPASDDSARVEEAISDRKRARASLRRSPDGWTVTIEFYEGGRRVETWTRTYLLRGGGDNGLARVKFAAARWLNGFQLRHLMPQNWERIGSDDHT